jgi:glycosyltransferase involved in cell wall biosynthesis
VKIAHILTYTYESGGTSKFVLDTAEYQIKQGDEVIILSVLLDGHTEYPVPEGVELKHFKPEFRTRFFPLYSSEMFKYIEEHQHEIDVFHLHCLWNYGEWAMHKLNLHEKTVITVHGSLHPYTFKGGTYWKRLLFTSLFQKTFMDKVKVIHVNHNAEKQAVVEYLDSDVPQIEVIPNGTNITSHMHDALLQRNRMQLLFLARMHHKKGIDLLLPAFKQVVSQFPDAELILAGPDEGMLAYVNKFVEENNLHSNVRYIGSISGEEKANYLKTAGVFVLPTYSEGFSLGILEALEYGIPIVCSDQTGLSPFLEDYNAAVVTALTSDSLAQGLTAVLKDPSLADELKTNGTLLIKEQFEKNQIYNRINTAIYSKFRAIDN